MTPAPFTLQIPEAEILDLKARLARTRFPDQAPGAGWTYGTDLAFMTRAMAHWRERYDWRATEAALNALPNYRMAIDGLDLHFLHVPGKGPDPLPLLLSHGWPGSVLEFLDLIPRLTDPAAFGGDPADAVTLVVPSLPGYTLSFAPNGPRYGIEEISTLFLTLMTALGYECFAAQGGDWGSFVTARMAHDAPERLIGIHLNMTALPINPATIGNPTPDEARYAAEMQVFAAKETGYQWIQGTKPQTLAYALSDSPAGLAAWMFEKFRSWTDCGGEVESALSMDRMLGLISLYWFTGCIGSSFHPYVTRRQRPFPMPRPIRVPTGVAAFPREIIRPPRSLVERLYPNLRQWTAMPRGGHFAAMEQPEALARDIQTFLRPLRRTGLAS
ncbi:epoxide hydrolase family protein [Pararhodobacter aggregans]|uniref:epoxide hydrolase family protein n=1 Tax=Pararhodobacter aggregans TaxID=404875 RepID=UPI003A930EFD